MKLRNIMAAGLITCAAALVGCGADKTEVMEPVVEQVEVAQTEQKTEAADDSQNLYERFLNDEIEAICINEDGSEWTFKYSELPHDPEEWDSYFVSDEKADLDNDGEDELIVTGPYGGMYLDERDDKVYVLAQGEGTAGELSYVKYEGKTYIVHRDTSHGGRQIYILDCYNGKGEVEDSFTLSAEYWENENDTYDENSDFTFRDEKISMDEFEKLRDEILGD